MTCLTLPIIGSSFWIQRIWTLKFARIYSTSPSLLCNSTRSQNRLDTKNRKLRNYGYMFKIYNNHLVYSPPLLLFEECEHKSEESCSNEPDLSSSISNSSRMTAVLRKVTTKFSETKQKTYLSPPVLEPALLHRHFFHQTSPSDGSQWQWLCITHREHESDSNSASCGNRACSFPLRWETVVTTAGLSPNLPCLEARGRWNR